METTEERLPNTVEPPIADNTTLTDDNAAAEAAPAESEETDATSRRKRKPEKEDYLFDAPLVNVPVPWGDDSILTVVMNKPEDQDYIDHEQGVKRVTVVVDETQMDAGDAHEANEAFYDAIVHSGFATKKGAQEPHRKFTAEQMTAWPFEFKDDVIVRMQRSTFEIAGGDDEFASLFNTGPITVVQTIGDFEDFVIKYEVNPISKNDRLAFVAAVEVKKKVKKKKVLVETELNLVRKGKQLFSKYLAGVTGGRIQMGPYSGQTRDEYLKQIDAMFQVMVIDTVVAYYGKAPK